MISFQGDFQKHLDRAKDLGAAAIPVRNPEELELIDALIIPGGESTTIGMLLERFDLLQPLRDRISAGMPVFSTCAGTILLADEIAGAPQPHIGGLGITVRRNAYGRQIESFEAAVEVTDPRWAAWDASPVLGVFIRAPIIEETSGNVDILMEFEGRPVAVRQAAILATTFHPELTSDTRIHRYFLEEVAGFGRIPGSER